MREIGNRRSLPHPILTPTCFPQRRSQQIVRLCAESCEGVKARAYVNREKVETSLEGTVQVGARTTNCKARYNWERGRPTARHGTIGSEDDQLIGTPADVVLSFLCVCNKTKARRHADYFLTSAAKRMLLTI